MKPQCIGKRHVPICIVGILLHLTVGNGEHYSTEKHLDEGLNHIRKTLNEINKYPHWVITKVLKEIKEMIPSEKEIQLKEDKNTSIKNNLLVLSYQGEKGIYIIVNSMKRYVNKILPENVKVRAAFTAKTIN